MLVEAIKEKLEKIKIFQDHEGTKYWIESYNDYEVIFTEVQDEFISYDMTLYEFYQEYFLNDLPEWLVEQLEESYANIIKAGGSIDINHGLGTIAITCANGEEYFIQLDYEFNQLIYSVPKNISEEVFILAQSNTW